MSSSQGPVVAEARLCHGLIDQAIVDPVQLQREEQEMRGDRGDLLLNVAVELGAHRIGGLAGIDEPGERGEAAEQVLQPLVADQRVGEVDSRGLSARKPIQPALVGILEGNRLRLGGIEIGAHGGRIHPGIERGEVPIRGGRRLRGPAGRGRPRSWQRHPGTCGAWRPPVET
jgi:hypothetical protein